MRRYVASKNRNHSYNGVINFKTLRNSSRIQKMHLTISEYLYTNEALSIRDTYFDKDCDFKKIAALRYNHPILPMMLRFVAYRTDVGLSKFSTNKFSPFEHLRG